MPLVRAEYHPWFVGARRCAQ